MSAFLGPIHFWLYKKIRLVIEREALLVAIAHEKVDDLAEELYDTALALYGAPIPEEEKLEAIIDHTQIHGWLQRQIEIAEVREASFIKDLIDTVPEEGMEALLTAFYTQGKGCGEEAKLQLEEDNAPALYKIMQNYYLNGMPCDAGDTIMENSLHCFSWEGSHGNQLSNWKKAGIDLSIMTKAYQEWFKGFIEGCSSHYSFKHIPASTPIYQISKD